MAFTFNTPEAVCADMKIIVSTVIYLAGLDRNYPNVVDSKYYGENNLLSKRLVGKLLGVIFSPVAKCRINHNLFSSNRSVAIFSAIPSDFRPGLNTAL